MRRQAWFAFGLIVALSAAPAVRAETLTDDAVVQLAQAGLSAEAIVAKVRASDSQFDVSTGALIWLKHQNVPDAVIGAMIEASANGGAPAAPADQSQSADPMVPHAAGVYLLETAGGGPRMQRLDPTVATDVRTADAIGWALTSGVVKLKITTVLANPTARFSADTDRPTFYFYFNQPGSGLYQDGLGMLRMPGPAPSPALFALIPFRTVGSERQLFEQRGFSGTTSGGVDKSAIAFSYTELSPGVFKVIANGDLQAGEYAFVYTPTDQAEGEDSEARYFDFSAPGP